MLINLTESEPFLMDWVCLAGKSRTSVTTGRIRRAAAHEWNEYLEA